jgi:ECF transporter S component (folate family)
MQKIRETLAQSAAEFKSARGLALAGLLAAVYAVTYSPLAGNIVIIQGVFEIRLGFIAIAAAAALLGPLPAAAAAVTGDLIGTVLFYGGSFFWGYTLSWALMGFGFGLILYKERVSVGRIVAASTFNTVVINMVFTTAWQVLMGFSPSYAALFVSRLPRNLALWPLNTLLLLVCLRALCAAYKKLPGAR